jgi:hypothetical protein
LIAELVRVEKEGGRITPDEMVAMVFLLLNAGSETTTHLISGSVFELLKDPAARDWLAADWSRAGLAVEEFLRFVSPVQFSKPRYVRQDVDLDGVKLKKGDRIMAMIVAANLDAQANECPNGSIWSGGRTGISRSAPEFISASAISSRGSKRSARCKRCSRAGPGFSSRSSRRKFAGGSGPAFAWSQSCPWRRGREKRAAIGLLELACTFRLKYAAFFRGCVRPQHFLR